MTCMMLYKTRRADASCCCRNITERLCSEIPEADGCLDLKLGNVNYDPKYCCLLGFLDLIPRNVPKSQARHLYSSSPPTSHLISPTRQIQELSGTSSIVAFRRRRKIPDHPCGDRSSSEGRSIEAVRVFHNEH